MKSNHDRRFRWLLAIQVVWVLALFLLTAWWGRLLLSQAEQINLLELELGIRTAEAGTEWMKTQRMLFWESMTFYALIVSVGAVLYWMYWRDVKRTREIQTFFATVTHEIKTPLTSIQLQAEALAQKGPNQDELINRLLEDTERLKYQLDQTLELARVEGGGGVFKQPVSLNSIVSKEVVDWQSKLSVSFDSENELKDRVISGDPNAISMILKNLFDNSLKHGDSKSPEVEIQLRLKDPGHLDLIYRDNGKGITEEQKNLGELFRKGSRSSGAGVGLYLVNVLMKKMGGNARYSHREDGRSGFEAILEFPLNHEVARA